MLPLFLSVFLGEVFFFGAAGSGSGATGFVGFVGLGATGFLGLGAPGFLDVSPLFDGVSFLDASTFLDASSFLDMSSFLGASSFSAGYLWSPFAAATFAVRLPFAAPVPCETTTQFPKPAVVLNEARQRFSEVPPVHLVSAGIWTLSSCVPTEAGFYTTSVYKGKRVRRKPCTGSPLVRISAGTKWVPFPDASTCTVLIDREPSAPLKTFQSADSFAATNERGRCTHESKPVMLAAKIPFVFTLTAVELSRF